MTEQSRSRSPRLGATGKDSGTMNQISEQDEFLLSQLLDGTLSEPEAADLRARLDRDPDLRAAFESLARVDRLLTERRGAVPEIDWNQLHAAVMQKIASPTSHSPRILQLPRWLRVAAPLAIAAAIALVFLVHTPFGDGGKNAPSGGSVEIVYHAPAAPIEQASAPAPDALPIHGGQITPQGGAIIVEFQRPDTNRTAQGTSNDPVEVIFPHSTELAEQVRKADQARESLPSWQLHMVTKQQEAPVAADETEIPPM